MNSKVSGFSSLALVLVAFSSLLSMFALTRIDSIIHQDLYRYGLQFSYEWAMPYWTMTTLVFVMGWFSITTSCVFQFYVLLCLRKEALKTENLKPVEEPMMVVEERREEAETLIGASQEEQRPVEEVEYESKPQEEASPLVEEAEEQETEPIESTEIEQEEPNAPAAETQPIDEERSEDTQTQVEVFQEETQSSAEDTELTEPFAT